MNGQDIDSKAFEQQAYDSLIGKTCREFLCGNNDLEGFKNYLSFYLYNSIQIPTVSVDNHIKILELSAKGYKKSVIADKLNIPSNSLVEVAQRRIVRAIKVFEGAECPNNIENAILNKLARINYQLNAENHPKAKLLLHLNPHYETLLRFHQSGTNIHHLLTDYPYFMSGNNGTLIHISRRFSHNFLNPNAEIEFSGHNLSRALAFSKFATIGQTWWGEDATQLLEQSITLVLDKNFTKPKSIKSFIDQRYLLEISTYTAFGKAFHEDFFSIVPELFFKVLADVAMFEVDPVVIDYIADAAIDISKGKFSKESILAKISYARNFLENVLVARPKRLKGNPIESLSRTIQLEIRELTDLLTGNYEC